MATVEVAAVVVAIVVVVVVVVVFVAALVAVVAVILEGPHGSCSPGVGSPRGFLRVLQSQAHGAE